MNNTGTYQMQMEQKVAEKEYFKARPQLDFIAMRRIFCTGFARGWAERNLVVMALQAQIDALMLEYCPDEMTAEQLEERANNQKPVGEPSDE